MATNTDISAQILLCTSLGLTNQQIMSLCDRAAAEFLVGKPQASYSIQGRTVAFQSMEDVRAMREYYSNAPSVGDRNYIRQDAEF